MIQAKELRIGNWIIDHEADSSVSIYWQIEEISKDGIKFRNSSSWISNNYIIPIELTEEWLLKFGFDKWSNKFIGIDTQFEILQILNNGTALAYDEFNNFITISNNIKYVHQIQNLYFSLTGKELEIKE